MLRALVAVACIADIAFVATAFRDRSERARSAEQAAIMASEATNGECRADVAAAARAHQPAFASRSPACQTAGIDVEAEYRAAASTLRKSAPSR